MPTMPKPNTVLTSMRLAANASITLALNVDLNCAAELSLNRLELLARAASSLEKLRKCVAEETGGYFARRTELLQRDFAAQRAMQSATYVDEAGTS